MSDYLKDILASGKKLIGDTKVPRQIKTAKRDSSRPVAAGSIPETDPHKILVKRAIQEKLKKSDVKSELQKFCDAADAKL